MSADTPTEAWVRCPASGCGTDVLVRRYGRRWTAPYRCTDPACRQIYSPVEQDEIEAQAADQAKATR